MKKQLIFISLAFSIFSGASQSEYVSEDMIREALYGDSAFENEALLALGLKEYDVNDYKFIAGFLPEKTEYVWGEPMDFFIYLIKNTDNKTLSFHEGLSGFNSLSAFEANGTSVDTPQIFLFGGISGAMDKLEPNQVYTKYIAVSRYLFFSGPGSYTVNGQRTIELGKSLSIPENINLTTSNSFKLIIQPYSKERMDKVIDETAEQIWNIGDVIPMEAYGTEPRGMTKANLLYRALSTLTTLKGEKALKHLISMAENGKTNLRVSAIKCLGEFPDDEALTVILKAFDGHEEPIRVAAAEALGKINSKAAIDALTTRLKNATPQSAAAILKAMGATKSPDIFDLLVDNLKDPNNTRCRGAVDGLVNFGGDKAVEALKTCLGHDDMNFREEVIRKLAESLNQPIDADWLVPVIIRRQSIGDAGRLARLYSGPKSVAALLSCLDNNNPSIRAYYNYSIIYAQSWCQGALKIPWISDLNGKDTPEALEHNQEVLRKIKIWVEHYYKYRLNEEPEPQYPSWPDDDKFWGDPVDDISVRIHIDQRVWPEGMPQLINFYLINNKSGGSVNPAGVPELFEVELNGDWYIRKPPLAEKTMGIEEGHGSSFNNLLLDDKWERKSDGRPLKLTPGKYKVRVGLSNIPESRRTGIAISRTSQFEIIETD
jgi:hypothetical protein